MASSKRPKKGRRQLQREKTKARLSQESRSRQAKWFHQGLLRQAPTKMGRPHMEIKMSSGFKMMKTLPERT